MSEIAMLQLLAILVWCHILLDYALQGDFMARAKNPFLPPGQSTPSFPGVPAWFVLLQHAFLQAGPVVYFTGSWTLGACELCAHYVIDYVKCENRISFLTDQLLHILCKIVWVMFAAGVIGTLHL